MGISLNRVSATGQPFCCGLGLTWHGKTAELCRKTVHLIFLSKWFFPFSNQVGLQCLAVCRMRCAMCPPAEGGRLLYRLLVTPMSGGGPGEELAVQGTGRRQSDGFPT